MLTNPIWEESHKKVINVNLSSKYLIPFVIFIYTGDVNFSNLEKEDLITFSFYCKKFLFKELQEECDKEIERINYNFSAQQRQINGKLSEIEIEKDEDKFNFLTKFEEKNKEIKELQKKDKKRDEEVKELRMEIKKRDEKNKKQRDEEINELKLRLEKTEGKFEEKIKKIRKSFENTIEQSRKRKRDDDDEKDGSNQKKKRKL